MRHLDKIVGLVWVALSLAHPAGAQGDLPAVAAGKIQRLEVPSANVPDRPIDVWLPPGYASTKRYAVLYMQDGQNLFDSVFAGKAGEWKVDESIAPLFKNGKLREFIVVAIHHAGTLRYPEYWPQKAWAPLEPYVKKRLLEQGDGMGKLDLMGGSEPYSDGYLRYLVQELKPYIDKNFSVMPERDNTFIAGSGMGGLVALYAVCEYPEVFGGAASLSTHWTGQRLLNKDVVAANVAYLKAHLPPATNHRIYMDVGSAGQEAFFVAAQKEVDAVFVAKGYTPSHLQTKTFAGQAHDETYWRKRFPAAIKFVVDGLPSAAPKGKK